MMEDYINSNKAKYENILVLIFELPKGMTVLLNVLLQVCLKYRHVWNGATAKLSKLSQYFLQVARCT